MGNPKSARRYFYSSWTPLALAAVLAASCPLAKAQTLDLEKDREHLAPMDAQWRFHAGDSPDEGVNGANHPNTPAWAGPGFDDSKWALLRGDKPWSEQGYKNYGGMAWYRLQVRVPAGEKRLALYVPRILTSYEIFADGQRIATFGGLPPRAHPKGGPSQVYALPQPASTQARTLCIAIRVWHWPSLAPFQGGGFYGGVLVGEANYITDWKVLHVHQDAWFNVDQISLAILEAIAGVAALAFFCLRIREKEYLWFGVALLLSSATRCFGVSASFHVYGVIESSVTSDLISTGAWIAQIAFYYRLLSGRRTWLFWSVVGALAAGLCLIFLVLADPELMSLGSWNQIFIVMSIPGTAWLLSLLIRRAVDGLPDARLLLAPVLLQLLCSLTSEGLSVAYQEGWYHGSSAWFRSPSEWPFQFSVPDIADALFLLAMLAILIGRFTRTRRQEEHYERELEAARTIQQVLIPEDLPAIPGFEIASSYHPAAEVGGDFFQILPSPDGAVLMVIGDVSGKGLQAAMMVSLIVGTLRTLAEVTVHPAEILAGLNRRLYGRSGGGFTTCLALRIDAAGTLTVANAGHLSPYSNGEELAVDGELPLGILPDASYNEATFRLAPGQGVTVMTDGVVEARDASGQLFGFERTQRVSTQSASEIALQAQAFGQDDDITVLTLTRTAAFAS